MSKVHFICLAGIDGAGKTTIAKEVLNKFKDYRYVWARWNPFFLKPFIQFLNEKTNKVTENKTKESVYSNKNGLKKKILKRQSIKQAWLFLAECDYFLQLIFKIGIPLILNKKILCDRYIYDFYIDQLINFEESEGQLSIFINHRILRIFPKPDLLIYIKISPVTGHRRKKDGTSILYLKKRSDYYDNLKTLYETIEVDGEESLGIVIKRVYKEISLVGNGNNEY